MDKRDEDIKILDNLYRVSIEDVFNNPNMRCKHGKQFLCEECLKDNRAHNG